MTEIPFEPGDTPESIHSREKVTEAVLNLAETLNGKTEYYIGGGLATFIVSGTEFNRNFSDIDIMVPESEITDVQSALESNGYSFWDERFVHQKNEHLVGINKHHEYGALRDFSDIRIGIYTFDTLSDGRIVFRQHFGEHNNNWEMIEKIKETILPPEISKGDLFSAEPTFFEGSLVYTATPEQVYIRKKDSKREKDIYDCEKIIPKLDSEKVARLEAVIPKIATNIIQTQPTTSAK